MEWPEVDYVKKEETICSVDHGAEQDDDIDFRLFAPSTSAVTPAGDTATQRIRLRSPSIDTSQLGFQRAERNLSYYFTAPISNAQKSKLSYAAVGGEQVMARSTEACPGNFYPWKVLHLPASQQSKATKCSAPLLFRKLGALDHPAKRTRPGKKYRIKLRMKRAAIQSRKEASKAAADAKEAAEREKRARKNREKKAKKRQRDKAKKAAAAGEEGSLADEKDDET
jgi:hypothetical protein